VHDVFPYDPARRFKHRIPELRQGQFVDTSIDLDSATV
jgi:hypothetical protein